MIYPFRKISKGMQFEGTELVRSKWCSWKEFDLQGPCFIWLLSRPSEVVKSSCQHPLSTIFSSRDTWKSKFWIPIISWYIELPRSLLFPSVWRQSLLVCFTILNMGDRVFSMMLRFEMHYFFVLQISQTGFKSSRTRFLWLHKVPYLPMNYPKIIYKYQWPILNSSLPTIITSTTKQPHNHHNTNNYLQNAFHSLPRCLNRYNGVYCSCSHQKW